MTDSWNRPIPEVVEMPKAELHLHLDGAPRWSAVRAALDRHYGTILPETPIWYEPHFRFASFAEFGALFREYTHAWLRTPTGYTELIREVLDALIAQSIRYAEINFNVRLVEEFGQCFEAVLESLAIEAERARAQGTIVRWFAGISRDKGIDQAAYWVQRILPTPLFVGFDLHGIEPGHSAALFQQVFAPALEAGKKLKVHAGEMAGADSIQSAIQIGAVQIGHGLSAIADPEVIALLRDLQIVIELCPTSNERLCNIPSYQSHPIFELDAAEVLVTINSDDPTFFGCNLTQEMVRLVQERNATLTDLKRWTENALHHAVLGEAERSSILAELNEWLTTNSYA
ncbi:adenosine deaminase family protein [Leptolyngbya sp. NIES-2104]|uniref:adenosine deaminase family protein n=1 Tax=Leptolyngbya sp. NIES-2104 TaxID=1552121 RepID=UPI0006EC5C49|nr:adenosine deaminase family protein [Leptolyngbya sp. NIES-2104]GAQ00023.1 adenosine deaminase [Leptolyngbya sp. NIES-2104]